MSRSFPTPLQLPSRRRLARMSQDERLETIAYCASSYDEFTGPNNGEPFSVCLAWKVNYSTVWGQTPEGKNYVVSRDYEDMTCPTSKTYKTALQYQLARMQGHRDENDVEEDDLDADEWAEVRAREEEYRNM